MVYAHRYNMGNSRVYFLASVLGAIPLSLIISRYCFGNQKIRHIEQVDRDRNTLK